MAVLVLDEDITLLDASDHDMLQDTDGIKAGKSWHAPNINTNQSNVKISTTSPEGPWTQFTGALTIDRTPPALGIKGHTILGTLEAGARVTVMAAAPLVVGAVQYPTATTWNCTVSNLAPGANQVVVTVSDEAGNLTYTTLLLTGY